MEKYHNILVSAVFGGDVAMLISSAVFIFAARFAL